MYLFYIVYHLSNDNRTCEHALFCVACIIKSDLFDFFSVVAEIFHICFSRRACTASTSKLIEHLIHVSDCLLKRSKWATLHTIENESVNANGIAERTEKRAMSVCLCGVCIEPFQV